MKNRPGLIKYVMHLPSRFPRGIHSVASNTRLHKMDLQDNLEHNIRHFITFGKLIGLYPSRFRLIRVLPIILICVTIVDFFGIFLAPPPTNGYRTAAEIAGRIGSPQFYAVGTFAFFYIQSSHKKLEHFFNTWKALPLIKEDKHLYRFTNIVSGGIMTSAILENISFHFKLFPILEPAVGNLTSFEVYYQRSHGFWSAIVPFTPYQATLLLITNKLALYAWNFSDLLAIILCRALRYRFDSLNENIEFLGPALSLQRHAHLIDLLRLLENYLSPLVFACFYEDFYATCMQLHMWMTPSEHKHFLHTIYLLWSFIHLIVRVFLLSYHASRLHETSTKIQGLLPFPPSLQQPTGKQLRNLNNCDSKIIKEISRLEFSQKRQLAISGLGCFFITKKFVLTLVYVSFSFQIFLMQSDNLKCP